MVNYHTYGKNVFVSVKYLVGLTPSTMGDDSEWMKLPIDQRCEHKVNVILSSSAMFLLFTCLAFLFVPLAF